MDTPAIRSVGDIRQAWGPEWANASDEQVISAYSQAAGLPISHVANALGYGTPDAGVSSNRLRSAGNDTAADLWGVGEAVTHALGIPGSDWMAQRRQNDEIASQIETQRAQNQGAIENLSDVNSLSDLGSYVAGQGIRAVPTIAEMAAGAALTPETGGASLAPLLARAGFGARSAMELAATSMRTARAIGGAAATYPQAVGDILQAQRQSGDGQTDIGSAMVGGVPMAALNAVGPENTLARGQLFRSGVAALDDVPGVRGLLARTAASAGAQASVGAAQGAGQELTTQYFGRMATDPNQSLWSDVEQGRVASAAAGGGLLGGALGAAGGGWRRSTDGTPAPAAADQPGADLLSRPQLGYQKPAYIAYPDGSVAVGDEARQAQDRAQFNAQYAPQDASAHNGTIQFADPQFQPQAPQAPAPLGMPAMDFERSALPEGPQSGPASRLQVPTVEAQGDLFGGPLDTRQPPAATPQLVDQAPAQHSTSQPDLFATTPTAAVRSDFGTGQVLTELRQANGGKVDQYTASVAQLLSDHLTGGPSSDMAAQLREKMVGGASASSIIDQLREKLETADLTKSTIDKRLAVLDAAQNVVDRYTQRMTDAHLQEAAQRNPAAYAHVTSPDAAELGQNRVATVTPPDNTTEMAMREANAQRQARGQAAIDRAQAAARDEKLAAQTADTDARVRSADQERADSERRMILDRVLNDPETRNPTGRFTATLKKAGITDTSIRPDEAARISRFHDIQEALKDNKDIPKDDVEPSAPNEFDPYQPAKGDTSAAPSTRADVHGSVIGDTKPEGAAHPAEARAGNETADAAKAAQDAVDKSAAFHDRAGELQAKADAAGRAVAETGEPRAKSALEQAHDELMAHQAGAEPERVAPAGKKGSRSSKLDRADMKEVDSAVQMYSDARHPDDAVRAAEWIRNESQYSPSKAVRDYAKRQYEQNVDKITRDRVEGRAQDRGEVVRNAQGPSVPPEHQLAKEDLQSLVQSTTSRIPNAPRIEVLDSPASLPPGHGIPPDVHVSGSTVNGKVYLFRSGISSPTDAARTVFHELFHQGLQKILPPEEYVKTMMRLQDGNAAVRQAAADWRLSPDGVAKKAQLTPALWHALSVEEGLAQLSETLHTEDAKIGSRASDVGAKIVKWMADLADRLGMPKLAEFVRGLSQNEAEKFVARAVRESGAERSYGDALSADRNRQAASTLPEPDQHGGLDSVIQGIKSAATDWRNRPWTLGFYTMRQIVDRFKDNELVAQHARAHQDMHAAAEHMMHDSNGVIVGWKNLQAEAQRALGKVMLESTMERVHPDKAFDHKDNAHLTSSDTVATEEARAAHARISAAYRALPDTAKKVFDAARADGRRQWDAIHQAMSERIMSTYAPQLRPYFSDAELREMVESPKPLQDMVVAGSKEAGLPYAARAALRGLIEDSRTRMEEADKMRGPYFPLVRNGNHVAVAKSPSLKRLQATFIDKRDALQELFDQEPPADPEGMKQHDEAVAAARRDLADAQSALETLKDDDRHYAVTFFENRWEAEAYQRKLQQDEEVKKNQLDVQLQQRAEYSRANDSVSPQFVRMAENQLRKLLPGSEFSKVQDAMREVYLRSLPDRSALKSELRRMNVPGARSTEMMRGFAARSQANAWRVSRMKYGDQIMDTLKQLRLSGNRDDVIIGDEFAKRLANSMNPPAPNALFRNLANISHLSVLGLSPSYLISQVAQPWVISAPIMAGRHGWAATGAHLAAASSEVMKVISAERAAYAKELAASGDPLASLKSWRFNLNPDQLGKTDGERAMINELFNNGLIDITVEHDLGAVARGGDGSGSRFLATASKVASTPAYVVEAVNRAATALAAYRMEVKKGTDPALATDYAKQVVADTHLDYTAANAPRLMRSSALGGLGQLLFQFKRFSQGMVYLQAKLIRQSLDANADPAIRGEARKAFAYLNGLTLAAAGASGFPLAGGTGLLFQALSKLWSSDDQPEIGEQLYAGLKDMMGETSARALVKGLPAAAGVDLSHKFGMGELTNPFRMEVDAKIDKDLFSQLALAMAGPAAGMMANWADAYDTARTDPMHAWEKVLPTVVANPLKAFDRSQRGIVSKSGKEVIGAQELGETDAILRSLGYESTNVTDTMERRSAFNAADQRISDARSVLLRNFTDDTLGGRSTADTMRKISEFNQRNPMNTITGSELSNALTSRIKGNATSVGGIPIYQPKSLDALRRVG